MYTLLPGHNINKPHEEQEEDEVKLESDGEQMASEGEEVASDGVASDGGHGEKESKPVVRVKHKSKDKRKSDHNHSELLKVNL